MPERHHLWVRVVAPLAFAVGACSAPELITGDVAAVQHAAATEIVASIVAHPGSIVVVCVGYEGGGGRPELPSVGGPAPLIAGADGCVEREGRLTPVDGSGQAVSVTVRTPEATGRSSAGVAVLTSTGGGDLAVYRCTIRNADGAWHPDGCELEAIS